jgi:ABC-type xylose transport system permease subunit
MSLMGTEPEYKYMTRGAVLILAVWMDSRLSERKA